jgi:hypothetical protein
VLSVKVTLQESAHPEIWRRLRVPADIRLDRFHQVHGAALGWQDSHLHVFEHSGGTIACKSADSSVLGAPVWIPGFCGGLWRIRHKDRLYDQ